MKKIMVLSFVLAIPLLLAGCALTDNLAEKATEKVAEKAIETVTNAEVDLGEGEISITGEDGESMSLGEDLEVPAEDHADLDIGCGVDVGDLVQGRDGDPPRAFGSVGEVRAEVEFIVFPVCEVVACLFPDELGTEVELGRELVADAGGLLEDHLVFVVVVAFPLELDDAVPREDPQADVLLEQELGFDLGFLIAEPDLAVERDADRIGDGIGQRVDCFEIDGAEVEPVGVGVAVLPAAGVVEGELEVVRDAPLDLGAEVDAVEPGVGLLGTGVGRPLFELPRPLGQGGSLVDESKNPPARVGARKRREHGQEDDGGESDTKTRHCGDSG